MGSRGGTLGIKRKRPGSDGLAKDLTAEERAIYNLIKSKGDMGIWKGDIRRELNMANIKVVDNCAKSLQLKRLIKEVPNVQDKGKKRLMATEFEPSKDLTGGVWYQDGVFDKQFIDILKKSCATIVSKQKVATADGILHAIKVKGLLNYDLMVDQLKEVLDNLCLEKVLVKAKSNGLGEFAPFPINAECYKLKPPHTTRIGALASIPCGVCPRINQCAPQGIINPVTCEYYTKWLDF